MTQTATKDGWERDERGRFAEAGAGSDFPVVSRDDVEFDATLEEGFDGLPPFFDRTGEPVTVEALHADDVPRSSAVLSDESEAALGRSSLLGPGFYFTDSEESIPGAGTGEAYAVTLNNPRAIDIPYVVSDPEDMMNWLPSNDDLQRLRDQGHDGIILTGESILGERTGEGVVFPEYIDEEHIQRLAADTATKGQWERDELGRFAETGSGSGGFQDKVDAFHEEGGVIESSREFGMGGDIDEFVLGTTRWELDEMVHMAPELEGKGAAFTRLALEQENVKVAKVPGLGVAGAVGYSEPQLHPFERSMGVERARMHIEYLGTTGVAEGTGSALTNEVIREAAVRGVDISLEAENDNAAGFFESVGFEEDVYGIGSRLHGMTAERARELAGDP